jgi:hypothetical protein
MYKMSRLALTVLLLTTSCIEQHPDWIAHGDTDGSTETGTPDDGAGDGDEDSASGDGDGTSGDGDGSSGDGDGSSGDGDGSSGDGDGSSGDGDGTSGDGDGDGSSGDGDGDGTSHILFITAGVYPSDFGSLSAADGLCMDAAATASLPGTWKAIISDSTEDAASRVNIGGPVRNVMGDLLAADAAELWGGALQNQVSYTQHGDPTGNTAWTGSRADGTADGFACDDWNPASSQSRGIGGHANATDSSWLYGAWQFCTAWTMGLYCIGQ